jgi:uncharacterized protein YwgA
MDEYIRFGIISYIIKRLGDNRAYFGKVVIQKIFYFLTSHSVLQLPYEFYFYHFGPYSDLLKRDLDMMQLFGLIEIKEDPQKMGYEIIRVEREPTRECEKDAESFIQKNIKDINKIIETFGSEEPADLELLATIHYVFERTKELHIEAKRHKQVVLEKVKELKPKFSPQFIEEKYDFLHKSSFFTCAK